ncbi:MAG: NAD-dependent epimerase/dehydratase family protein, partial [Lactococcus sp.]|nr:NAD-dependent epimerase/dehydratase family protein [Lactococcus sp.]
MKILITGATGVLGKRITKHLAKIHDVAGLTRTKSGADMLHTLNARAYIGDIRDKAFVFDMV